MFGDLDGAPWWTGWSPKAAAVTSSPRLTGMQCISKRCGPCPIQAGLVVLKGHEDNRSLGRREYGIANILLRLWSILVACAL